MVIIGYMVKEVKIAEFKAHLSEHLRAVRQGHSVLIKDRQTPIARVTPYQKSGDGLPVREPTRSLQEIDRMLDSRTGKRSRLKPGVLDRVLRRNKMDWLDK